MSKCKTPWNPQLVIPKTFEQCLTYEKQVLWLYKKLCEIQEMGGIPGAQGPAGKDGTGYIPVNLTAKELTLEGAYGYCGKYDSVNAGEMTVKPMTQTDYTVSIPAQSVIVSNQAGIFPLGIKIEVRATTQDGEKDFGTHFVSAVAEMTAEGVTEKHFTLKIPVLHLIKQEASHGYDLTLTSNDDLSTDISYN